MGTTTQSTADGLPVLNRSKSVSDTTDDGLPILKKKQSAGAGSPSPSDSSPKPVPTEPSVDTSGSGPKQVTANYKNNSLTPSDVPGNGTGPTPDMVAMAINNKGKNADKWKNSPSNQSSASLLKQKNDLDAQISSINTMAAAARTGLLEDDKKKLEDLTARRDYLNGEINKNYNFAKEKIVPELTETIKESITDDDFNHELHTLKPKAVQRIAGIVDGIMNKRNDSVVNAAVSGDLDNKERTYADLTKSVVDRLNIIPIQQAQQQFTRKYAEKNPEISDALKANEEVNEYFSHEKLDDLKAKINIDADKERIQTQHKYFGEDGIFMKNQDYVGIQHKYAELVGAGKMTDEVARKQIEAEIAQNPSLKKIKSNYDAELRKVVENTQKRYEQYLISGLQKKHPQYTIYPDGTPGLASLSQDQFINMVEGYQEGMDGVAKKMGAESNEAWKKMANEKANRVGPFWGSMGMTGNALMSGLTKWWFNKTGWGGEKVRNFEATEIASPQVSQSDVAATWNWKGWESLLNPNFYASGIGGNVPVLAGAAGVGLATEGAGLPEYIGWLSSAGLFTAQSSLSTYDRLLNSRDDKGRMLSESDASHYAAKQAEDDFLPNVLMMALGSGTLLKAKNIVKPTILGTIGEGIKGAAAAQPFFTWQGYNEYATMLEAQGKKPDMFDYLQSKDFRDNLVNGLVIGGGIAMLHAPLNYMKSMDNWTKMVHTSEGEFKNLIPQNYALGQEMAGNGNYLRDALKLHVFNIDPEGLNEEGKRNLSDLKNTLLYSVNLDKNIRTGNLDRTNINDLYQAHNLALADQHDYLSEQAAKEGNKSLSDIYKDKAKDYREQAKAAANGEAKYHYLTNDEGHPIFMSNRSFKTLEQEGTLAKWTKDGTVKDVHSSDDPEFAQRYKDFVTAKSEATVEGKDVMDHAADLIEQNKDKLKTYYAVAKENPELFYKEVADQIHGINADGSTSLRPDAEIAARENYGDDIVDLAKVLYPLKEENVNTKVGPEGSIPEKENEAEPGSGTIPASESSTLGEPKTSPEKTASTGEYKPQIRDDYFARSDFFTPEEKEKFATLDDAGKDKMIDDKRSELKEISSPKTEKDGKTKEAEKTEGRQGDVLAPDEGGDKNKLMKEETPPPSAPRIPPTDNPPPSPPVSESPKDEFTGNTKARNREIEGAKELFEKQGVIHWSETFKNALSYVIGKYPEKSWYEALKNHVNHFTGLLDAGVKFNPTSEDHAAFLMFKHETLRQMGSIDGWDSPDDFQRQLADIKFQELKTDLFNTVRVTNPGGETGRALQILQAEIGGDIQNGLKIRRMELTREKGAPLNREELESSAEDWEKEKAQIQKEHELEIKNLKEKFDQHIAKLKGEKSPKFNREKAAKVAISLRGIADRVENFLKANLPEGTQRMGTDFQKKVADAIRWIAEKIEKGDIRIPDIIAAALDKFRGEKDENELKDAIHKGLSEAGVDEKILKSETIRKKSFDKIKELADADGATEITNDMVAKNLIRDFVKSHVGLTENADVVDKVTQKLKTILPDTDENQVRKAFLKEDEFRQPTKKEIENAYQESQRKFTSLTKLDKDIADLKEKQTVFKRGSNKAETPYDKELDEKEKEKNDVMNSLGVKVASEDKYTKASYDLRAKSHNQRLDNLSNAIKNKLESGSLTDDQRKQLLNLKGKIDNAKINLNPNSAESQEKTLSGGAAFLKSIQSEFLRNTDRDIAKMGDIRRGMQKVLDEFDLDNAESTQDIKVKRAIDKAKRDAEMWAGKLSRDEFEDHQIVELTKTNAELLKAKRDTEAIRQLYENKKKKYQKQRKDWAKKTGDFLRAAEVGYLIGSPFTLAKVGASALLRPQLEALSKLGYHYTLEQIPTEFNRILTERAKLGGESTTLASIKRGYQAYLKQYGEEGLKKLYAESNEKYEKADKAYMDQEAEVNRVKYMGMDKPEYKDAVNKLEKLKNEKEAALVDAVGNSVYQFIAGSSIKEAIQVFMHRSTVMERQMGNFDVESWDTHGKNQLVTKRSLADIDNWNYILNGIGRSHAALKNFSGRFSFATGFMARLEYYAKQGVDISKPEKLLEIAHESYGDWERGKYQESNWISDRWNKLTRDIEKNNPEMAYLMRTDVAITRVPVNMLYEGIMEYTMGGLTGSVIAAKEYYKALPGKGFKEKVGGRVLQFNWDKDQQEAFRKDLYDQLGRMDPKSAAAIVRAYRKQGFGMGMYALFLLGHAAFGGYAHRGQTAEDKKKALRELQTGTPEIKTGQIKLGDWTMPDIPAKIIEHTPGFQMPLFALGLNQVYENSIVDGKSTPQAVKDAALAHINHIINSIPQMELITALGSGLAQKMVPTGEWNDVDENGIPMERRAFRSSDYFNYLHLPFTDGFKKDILSENYYKQAVKAQTDYRNAITEIETDTNLSSQDKKEQREDKLKEFNDAIDEIYVQNKENPQ